MTPGRHVLVCAQRMPEYDRESGSRRLFDLVSFLREEGWAVSYVAHDPSADERYVRMLQQLGVAVYRGLGPDLEELVRSSHIDVALMAFWHVAEVYLPLLRRAQPEATIIVDSIDLHFVREARERFHAGSNNGGPRLLDIDFAGEMVRELNVYIAADSVFAVSDREAALVSQVVSDDGLGQVVRDCEELARLRTPPAERAGILFVGNFWHKPNVDAAEFLCRDIVPLLDDSLLARHPVHVVGHQLNDTVRRAADGHPHVHMVGWVPTLEPYWARARVSVIPLRYGAGTKRKLVQALMVGTPTVSTTVGVEGLDVRPGEDVLVADDPETFAAAVTRLLEDDGLWRRIARSGRARIGRTHGREAVKAEFVEALSRAMARPRKPVRLADQLGTTSSRIADVRQRALDGFHRAVEAATPPGSTVGVVSRGDEAAVALEERAGWHFPRTGEGEYAGYHPADSEEAVAQLEQLRSAGAEFLAFPASAAWWLDHYEEFGRYLEANYVSVASSTPARIFDIRRRRLTTALIEQYRPQVASNGRALRARRKRPLVVVTGVFLAGQDNSVEDIVATLGDTRRFDVVQRWTAIGTEAPTADVADVTVASYQEKRPKFELVGDMLADDILDSAEYVLVVDDDVILPRGFLDRFLQIQGALGFAMAQPARTRNSFIDHPIVEQQLGALARRTRFVEIGPVFSCHRGAFPVVLPFELDSPMGWGYESVWSYRLEQRGLPMGIIDATPVDHSLREPVRFYDWNDSNQRRNRFLEDREHLPLDQCFQVLEVWPAEESR